MKLAYRAEVQLGKMLDARQIVGDHLRHYLRNVDVQWGRINVSNLPEMDFDDADRRKFSLQLGDILVCEGGEIGRAAIWKGDLTECYFQKALHRLRPIQGDESRFVYWLITGAAQSGAFSEGSNRTTIEHLPAEKLRAHVFPFPPLPEQRAIADFLDRETAKIDALIAKQEELIERIEEKHAAAIANAVTKGLDPSVRMRPTGFEWIGEIPEHWLVRPLKRQASRIVVGIAEAATHAYADAGVPIIRSTNVFPNRIETQDLLFLNAEFAEDRGSKMILAGDLLTARTGNAGVTAVVPEELDRSQCFTMLITSLRSGYIPAYFSYFINSKAGTTFYDLESWGTAQRNISVPILGDTPVCVPPTREQEEIADFVRGLEKDFEALRAAAVRHCDLLVEHRSAIITAAITGQIEVAANIAAEAAA